MDDVDPLMLIGIGACAGLVLIVLIFVLTLRLKRRRRAAEPKPVEYDKATSAQTSVNLPAPTTEDDCNPDVIPHTTGWF